MQVFLRQPRRISTSLKSILALHDNYYKTFTPKSITMAPHKRTASDSPASNQTKRAKTDLKEPHPNAKQTEDFGIVLREFYPPEMSNDRCMAYIDGELQRPIEVLQDAYKDTLSQREKIKPSKAVVHWFKTDLRLQDNRALHEAYTLAKDNGIPLICVFILSPEDLTAHIRSPARVDLVLRTLELLKKDLSELDIPLYMETQEHRKAIPGRLIELCQEWGANNLHLNLEYEVDELRREAKLVRLGVQKGIKVEASHDICVVTPGALATKQGKQYAVYSHWYRSWVAHVKSNPDTLEPVEKIGHNSGDARKSYKSLFTSKVPQCPKNKELSEEEKKRFREMYPEGEHEAVRRLNEFLKEKGKDYANNRDYLSGDTTSSLSPYFSLGSLNPRTAVSAARQANRNGIDKNNPGYMSWISEVAWRDFYKHVLVHWPFICMNKCFKPLLTNVEWEYNLDHFNAWCQGKTGFPIVDAAMRQLQHCAWMHNRARMIVASFLSKDLMIDWRRGERFFMENLIDGDFASNHGGWGFSSSTGVDPQPYFRIFNPLRQSERFDHDGEYIRRWIPELRGIKGSAIHDPYNHGAGKEAEKNGYPRPIVDHAKSRERALQRFKDAS